MKLFIQYKLYDVFDFSELELIIYWQIHRTHGTVIDKSFFEVYLIELVRPVGSPWKKKRLVVRRPNQKLKIIKTSYQYNQYHLRYELKVDQVQQEQHLVLHSISYCRYIVGRYRTIRLCVVSVSVSVSVSVYLYVCCVCGCWIGIFYYWAR